MSAHNLRDFLLYVRLYLYEWVIYNEGHYELLLIFFVEKWRFDALHQTKCLKLSNLKS